LISTRNLSLLLIGLITLSGVVVFIAVQTISPGSTSLTPHLAQLIFGLMIALSITLTLYVWRSYKKSVNCILDQLRQFEKTNQIGMIMVESNDELAELVTAINRHLTNVKFEFEKWHTQQKELQIQVSVAETEKCQAEAVICSISDSVIVTDQNAELVLANKSAQDLFEFSLDLNYRLPINQVIKIPEIVRSIQHVQEDKDDHSALILEYTHPQTDKLLSLKMSTCRVYNSQRQPIGVVAVIQDITTEQEISKMKDDIISSVSHELKTPLASIRAYAEMLADDEADNHEQWHDFCDIIQNQALHLNHMIDDVLNISRIEANAVKVFKQPINLNKLIDDVSTVIGPQAKEKNVKLAKMVGRSTPVINADHDMIYQAVLNLLSNAVKYSHPGGEVMIRCWRDSESSTVIEIKDYGIGIPDDELENVFQKFYRVPDNNKSGTGLGLHLVRQVIEIVHKGRVRVESKLGQGSTFTIYLPQDMSVQIKATDMSQ